MAKGIGNELATALLKKHPKAASKQLSRMLRKSNPEVFTTDNQADLIIRRLRGAQGALHRKKIAVVKEAVRTTEEAEETRQWGALLPDADDTGFMWHELNPDVKRYGIICDLHIPYHDHKSLKVAMERIDGDVDGLIMLGDVVDAYSLSSFCRDPRKRGFVKEVEAVNKFFDAVQAMNLKHVIWKCGNHELRLERYLMQRAPELPGLLEAFTYRKQCKLDERGWEWIPDTHPIRHGRLTLLHGHEWGNRFSSPVNQARGAYLKASDCTIEGHGHRSSYHAETSLMGRVTRCWSIGCLCNKNPEYRPLGNKWDSGMAFLNTGHDWSIENLTIIDGKVF